MSLFNIEKAIVDAIMVIASEEATPLELPEITLAEASKQELWLKLTVLPATANPVTLGDAGEDNFPGVIQIDINYPKNSGTGYVLKMAEVLRLKLPAGTTFTYLSQAVKLLGVSLSGGRYVGGYYRRTLSINYYARAQRR